LRPPRQGRRAHYRVRCAGRADYAGLLGLPGESRLAGVVGSRLRLVVRAEAPVLDLTAGWESVYAAKLSSKRRSAHRKRLRDLEEAGRVEITVARTLDELEPALEEVFRIHALRWAGLPDASTHALPRAREFHRAALRALAADGVPRISTLRLDGRAIAFRYYLILERTVVGNGIGHDPAYARFSPGWVLMLATLEAAAAEGAERVEFMGGDESYKLQFADRFEPIYQGLGLARSAKGRAAVTAKVGMVQLRRRLKRSPLLHRVYYGGLAPARKLVSRVRGA